MIEEENLKLINSMNICKGLWTWTRTIKKTGKIQKSINDYGIIDEEAAPSVTKATIDEEN